MSARRGDGYYVPYERAVEAVGAEAVELPAGTTALPEVDGLLLPGGWDLDPSLYGEEPDPKVGPVDRELDDTELRLFAQARDRGLPVMGICRGQQVINVAMGGSLLQHLDGHEVRSFGRSHLAHTIEVDPKSELGRAAGLQKLRVNSLHHQAIGKLAPGLMQTARGYDGVDGAGHGGKRVRPDGRENCGSGRRSLHVARDPDRQPGYISLDLPPQRSLRAAADDGQAADIESGVLHRLQDVAQGERAAFQKRTGHMRPGVGEAQAEEDTARGAIPLRRHRALHTRKEDESFRPRRHVGGGRADRVVIGVGAEEVVAPPAQVAAGDESRG